MEENAHIDDVNQKLHIIEEKLDELLRLLKQSEVNDKKLHEHIRFVENVYSIVKTPAEYVTRKINSVMGHDNLALPDIRIDQ